MDENAAEADLKPSNTAKIKFGRVLSELYGLIDWPRIGSTASLICFHPRAAWAELKENKETAAAVYLEYVLPLALLGPLCQYFKMILFGEAGAQPERIYWGLLAGISFSLTAFLMSLVGIASIGLSVWALSPRFGAPLPLQQGLKLAGWVSTPALLAGLLNIIPGLRIVSVLICLYSFFLYWEALSVFASVPQPSAVKYFSASLGAAFLTTLAAASAAVLLF